MNIHQLAAIVINSPLPKTNEKIVANIMTIVFGTLGAVSVLIIIWAGFKYTMSAGDPSKTAEARNQILYAAIGLAIAVSAGAIVTYATRQL